MNWYALNQIVCMNSLFVTVSCFQAAYKNKLSTTLSNCKKNVASRISVSKWTPALCIARAGISTTAMRHLVSVNSKHFHPALSIIRISWIHFRMNGTRLLPLRKRAWPNESSSTNLHRPSFIGAAWKRQIWSGQKIKAAKRKGGHARRRQPSRKRSGDAFSYAQSSIIHNRYIVDEHFNIKP